MFSYISILRKVKYFLPISKTQFFTFLSLPDLKKITKAYFPPVFCLSWNLFIYILSSDLKKCSFIWQFSNHLLKICVTAVTCFCVVGSQIWLFERQLYSIKTPLSSLKHLFPLWITGVYSSSWLKNLSTCLAIQCSQLTYKFYQWLLRHVSLLMLELMSWLALNEDY